MFARLFGLCILALAELVSQPSVNWHLLGDLNSPLGWSRGGLVLLSQSPR